MPVLLKKSETEQRHDDGALRGAFGDTWQVAVLPRTGAEVAASRLFLRRAVKVEKGGGFDATGRRVDWLVAELNGVRLYIDEQTRRLVMTTADLTP